MHILFRDPLNSLYVGKTDALNAPFFWDYNLITNPHIAIVGISGSGKSYFIKTLLVRASFVWNSNAIIIDWAGEYKDWVMQTGGKIIQLGKGNYLNLLDLGGMKPYDRIKQVMRTVALLTDMENYPEQKRLTEEAIERAYMKAKFKMDINEQKDELGRPLEAPTLKDVVAILEERSQMGTYEFPAELDNAIYRLKRFTKPGEDFFANKSTVDLEKLTNTGLVDIDLSGLPDESMRALGGLTILQFIKERMRLESWSATKGLKLITVLDEAWKVSSDPNSDAVMIVREGRKYNFGLIIASQNPTDISEVIFSNVGTTFILKVKFEKYLDYLQGTLNFSNYIRTRIRDFGVGQAAVNVAFHTPESFPTTFIIGKIAGEEPLKEYFLDLKDAAEGKKMKGGAMAYTVSIKKDEIRGRLRSIGVDEQKIDDVVNLFEKNNRHVDVITFVITLERMGVTRRTVSSFLKEMGIDDTLIINIFTKADFRKEGKTSSSLSQVVLEDEGK
jgi:DNA helicase HerA-like ATPase